MALERPAALLVLGILGARPGGRFPGVTGGQAVPKNHGVVCWYCHREDVGELHENYPVQPDSEEARELGVDEAMETMDEFPLRECKISNRGT